MQETMYRVIQNSRIFLNIMFETVMNKNFRVLKSFSRENQNLMILNKKQINTLMFS